MHITAPHFGSYRPQSAGFDPSNSRSSATSSKISVDLSPVSPSSVSNAPSSFDSDTVSKNILSFVQRRLAQAQQQGASKDDLASLLEQARSGAASGFDQAVAQLKGNGSLNDSLSSGISSALQKVDKGFDDLAKQLGLATDTASAPTASAAAPQASTLSQLAASYSASFSSKQSVDLLVKTADGDTVHLQLGVKNKQSVSASYQTDGSGQQLNISSSQKSSAGLSISVDGNLDQGELQALNDLLQQVGNLADTFFSGDLAGALQQAGTLDFSNPELSSLALNLRSETRIKEKVAAYQQVQNLPGTDTSANGGSAGNSVGNSDVPALSTLSSLADALSSLLPQASTAANPAGLLKQFLAAQIGATNVGNADLQNNPLLNFANRLLIALGADAASSAGTADTTAADTTVPSTTSNTIPASTTLSTSSAA